MKNKLAIEVRAVTPEVPEEVVSDTHKNIDNFHAKDKHLSHVMKKVPYKVRLYDDDVPGPQFGGSKIDHAKKVIHMWPSGDLRNSLIRAALHTIIFTEPEGLPALTGTEKPLSEDIYNKKAEAIHKLKTERSKKLKKVVSDFQKDLYKELHKLDTRTRNKLKGQEKLHNKGVILPTTHTILTRMYATPVARRAFPRANFDKLNKLLEHYIKFNRSFV